MKTNSLWIYFLMGALLLILLTACATAAPAPTATKVPLTATAVPPPATPLPPTEVPKPTSCDEVAGTCLQLTFDGENCTYEGPAEHKSGAITVLFINQSDQLASMELGKHTGDESLQDTIDYWEDGPKHGHPSWAEWVGVEDASAGKSDIWEGNLQSGTYFLVCAQGLPFQWWLGVGFSVEN